MRTSLLSRLIKLAWMMVHRHSFGLVLYDNLYICGGLRFSTRARCRYCRAVVVLPGHYLIAYRLETMIHFPAFRKLCLDFRRLRSRIEDAGGQIVV